MKYADFIAELERLIGEGRSIAENGLTHKDPRFRRWRHEAESIVEDAKVRGLRVPGEFNSSRRSYLAMWSGATEKDNINSLRAEISDSLVELAFIVQQYQKYGEPSTLASEPETKPLTTPDRGVTLAWLWHNVPASLWFAAFGLAVTIFLAGVGVGQTKLYHTVVGLFDSAQAEEAKK